ncbi:Retinol dehydrogenase 12 [Physocladia obscura]|uniref:Retinol dehydrogenase 12 n=1 Tax=Physocladia obscura TaxID=109957 RepID=A0AAD5T9C3_9FUNG|nr:Retinol dehydrogenase 12 [Physocladia obscura]
MPKVREFNPHGTIDLSGKVVLITGGSAGIGKVNVRQFAELGAKVYVVARNKEKTQAVVDEVRFKTGNKNVFFVYGELDKLESVKAAGKAFLEKENRLHILVCNAGTGSRTKVWTSDGFEVLFGQNYLAHVMLLRILLDCLKETANSLNNVQGCVRIVNVSSRASDFPGAPSKIDFDYLVKKGDSDSRQLPDDRKTIVIPDYSVSKLCQVLQTIKLSEVLKGTGISAYSLHPGMVQTGGYDKIYSQGGIKALIYRALQFQMINEEDGSLTTLYCAVSNEAANDSGLFYENCAAAVNNNKAVKDRAQIEKLWTKSFEWTESFI